MTDRQCSKCLSIYPATLDYFHTEGNNRGLRKECKTCSQARARAWRKNNPDKVREYSRRKYAKLRSSETAWAKTLKRAREQRQRKKVQQWARLMGVRHD